MMYTFLRNHIEETVAIPDTDFQQILPFFSLKKFRKGEIVLRENQNVNEMFLVKNGILKSSMLSNNGKLYILQFASEHWWISDFSALFKHKKASLRIDCVKDTCVYAISISNFNQVCELYPKMERFFRIKSNMGYAALQERILSLISKNTQQQYEEFVQKYPHLINQLPKQLIANYLGVSRETLSRLYI